MRNATYAKQARDKMRSAAKGAALLGGAAGVAFAIWGYGWYVTVLLGLAGFACAICLLEWFTARYNERHPDAP